MTYVYCHSIAGAAHVCSAATVASGDNFEFINPTCSTSQVFSTASACCGFCAIYDFGPGGCGANTNSLAFAYHYDLAAGVMLWLLTNCFRVYVSIVPLPCYRLRSECLSYCCFDASIAMVDFKYQVTCV